jgi:outer membrane receptor for ferrienterochelin and colicin
MRTLIRLIFTFLFFFLISSNIFSQSGKIAGKIIDASSGEGIPFVNVIIMNTNTGAASDIDGNYYILNIPPGEYSVRASAIGYNAVTVQNIRVASGFTTSHDFELAPTSLELKEEVIVTADRPLVQRDLTATTSIVGADMISQLPVTDIRDVLQLQAGIVQSGGDLHLRGGRKGQIAFQVDGVPMTDAYDGSTVVDVNADAVQELQVISGAFNAEYGQAMSGIVNIVTKDGNNQFNGNIITYSGDYFSNRNDKFWNIDNFEPVAIRNIEGSLSGPVIKDNLFFYLNGRYFYNTGYLFGRRQFLTTDRAAEALGGGTDYTISSSGDGKFVPMNPNERIYGQGKLTYRLLTGMKLSFNSILDKQEYKDYNHGRRLTPDNNLQRFRTGTSNTLTLNHALSASSFYNLNFSYFIKDYEHYLFKDISPDLYVNNYIRSTPPYSFEVGGTDYSRFNRNTNTMSGKLDWTTQLNQEVNIQFGGELRQHNIKFHEFYLYPDDAGNILIPLPTTPQNNRYHRKPQERALYVQSKLEAYSLIFNLGLRLDSFDPDGVVLSDPSDPNIINPLKPSNRFHDLNGNGIQDPGEASKTVAEREAYWYRKAEQKFQFSPRIGLAFPITERGVIHFSYGHFLQLPPYEYLYHNPEFELGVGSGNQGLFGNADLKPQKTVKGEIGLQQQLTEDIAVDFTVFFEDFRDLTGTQTDEILVFGRSVSYSQYSNSDFGFSKGFIVKLEKRFSDGLAMSIDYTYSETKGNSSNPADAMIARLGGRYAETTITPLNWNQPHTLNISAAYSVPSNWGVSVIGNFYSGQPYTPVVNKNTTVTQNAFPTNSELKPTIFNLDLRAYKDFNLGGTNLSVFVKVFNLLDFDNARNVYSNSGDPLFTFDRLDAERTNPKMYYNTLDDLFTNPGFFSEPRRVEFGVAYNF